MHVKGDSNVQDYRYVEWEGIWWRINGKENARIVRIKRSEDELMSCQHGDAGGVNHGVDCGMWFCRINANGVDKNDVRHQGDDGVDNGNGRT